MTFKTDVVVIGAGVVGLAIARAFALRHYEVIVLEQHATFGTEISSRHSEVIHAGLYYPTNSLKAKLCVQGRQALYAYCKTKQIPHKRTGKLIVATRPSQLTALQRILQQANENGVDDVVGLTPSEILALEPNVVALGALLSPSTGIIDSHTLMLNFIGDLESHGGHIAYHCPVQEIIPNGHGAQLTIADHDASQITAKLVINSAGLAAVNVAQCIKGFPKHQIPTLKFAKGSYFRYTAPCPFKHLIYPIPEPGGLGTHLTLDLAGNARFGPNVEWVQQPNYEVSFSHRQAFATAIYPYFPSLNIDKLVPDYAGVRPKIWINNTPKMDFHLSLPNAHAVPGIVNLFGIESPGLTSCLAIADHLATQLTTTAL